MVETASTMLPLGTRAPEFSLPEPATGKIVSLADFNDKPMLLVAFICNHCPYVIRIKEGLTAFANEQARRGLAMVAINSNDVEVYTDDRPELMVSDVKKYAYPFPYLFDAEQSIAKAYHAACTPDFFLFDAERKLVYRGQFDEARPGNDKAADGHSMREAIDALLLGQKIPAEQKASIGCNIKWRPGQAPKYFSGRSVISI